MRHLPMLLLATALAAISVVAQVLGSWVLTYPVRSPGSLLFGAAWFIVPAAFLGVVAGATLGRMGAWVLLVPLGVIVFVVLKGAPWPDGWLDPALAPLLATCAAPYAVGWWVGWAIRVRRDASRSRQVLTSGPNWTSPDVKHRT
jgi:NhaP-type Na+/H+ or K+/H+ antiporter